MSSSLNDTSCPVTVVPMFAPKITPMACWSDRRPAFTKPTVITLVAEELWMSIVTVPPASIAATRLRVTYASMAFILSPATWVSPSDMRPMPYTNIARPPNTVAVNCAISMTVIPCLIFRANCTKT